MSLFPFLNLEVGSVFDYLPEPISCSENENIRNIIDILKEKNIGSIVIIDENNIVKGIFTERDYVRKVAMIENLDTKTALVKDYMTDKIITVTKDVSTDKLMSIMRLKRFRHIVIAGEEGQLIKVISIKDILDFLCDSLHNFE